MAWVMMAFVAFLNHASHAIWLCCICAPLFCSHLVMDPMGYYFWKWPWRKIKMDWTIGVIYTADCTLHNECPWPALLENVCFLIRKCLLAIKQPKKQTFLEWVQFHCRWVSKTRFLKCPDGVHRSLIPPYFEYPKAVVVGNGRTLFRFILDSLRLVFWHNWSPLFG